MTPRTPSSPSQDFLASHRWELHPMAIPKPSRARSWSLFPTSHSRLCHRSFPEHITEVHRTFVPAIPLELEFPSRFFRLEKVIFQSHLPKPSLTCRLIGGGGLSSGFLQPSGTQCDVTYFCGLRQSGAGPALLQLYTPSAQPRGGARGLMGTAVGGEAGSSCSFVFITLASALRIGQPRLGQQLLRRGATPPDPTGGQDLHSQPAKFEATQPGGPGVATPMAPTLTLLGLDKTLGHSLSIGPRLKGTHLMEEQIKAHRGVWLAQVSHGESLSSAPPSKAEHSTNSRASETKAQVSP